MLKRVAGASALLAAFTSLADAQATVDAALTRGIAQVQDGRWMDAVPTLNDVVRRFSAVPARTDDLAQAHLWLGIAYAQMDSENSGRTSFREAMRLDARVSLAEGWPAKVSRLFAAAKNEAIVASLQTRGPDAAWLAAWRQYREKGLDSLTPEEEAVYGKARWLADGLELDETEALLRDWMTRHPKSARACDWLAEFLFSSYYGRPARFDDGMEVAEQCVTLDDPKNPTSRQALAQNYWDKAYRDSTLTDEQKERYADRGLKYVNLALKINPNLVDSMIYKGLLLRTKAQLAKDEKQRNAYLFEAKLLQEEAVELRKSGKGEFSGAAPLPPPPTLPPATGVTGSVIPPSPPAPVRVGGDIIEPAKVKNVPPVYPPIAIQARVQGIVILECTIDARGNVADARVLRSIPLLDQAAIDAVKQWVYQPTFLNGVPVPVIMTVTVNFGLN